VVNRGAGAYPSCPWARGYTLDRSPVCEKANLMLLKLSIATWNITLLVGKKPELTWKVEVHVIIGFVFRHYVFIFCILLNKLCSKFVLFHSAHTTQYISLNGPRL